LLKGELGFGGFVVSDWGGVKQLLDATYADQVARAVNAGVDMIMVPDDYVGNINAIVADVNAGKNKPGTCRRRGDPHPERQVRPRPVQTTRTPTRLHRWGGSAAHRDVARQAVRESLVLLKNSNNALPLSKAGTYKIVVGGKSVDNLGYQLGGWSITWQGGSGATTTGTTFWQALQQATTGTKHHPAERRDQDEGPLLRRRRHLGGRRDALRRGPGRLLDACVR